MKNCLFLSIILVGMLFVSAASLQTAFAERGEEYEHQDEARGGEENEARGGEENEAFEETGKSIGWGTAAAMAGAAVLFPLRRSSKRLLQRFPRHKAQIVFLLKRAGSWHIAMGVAALLFGAGHGVLMYIGEGELEARDWIGVGAVGFMAVGAIAGGQLARKKAQGLRFVHMGLLLAASAGALLHIALS
ncbi:hypothetical protein [Ectobacillus ponti]|uniref:DUF1294 domain-containing protein n=1 Tax=Ectobacillus ponti TaxID=2961894 RepID=A0AA41XDD4_9BACI|nr:hypothetical protein [Ectobacillus ponti]MCP8971299.1 hypothetical protein [Ectobacillus ponti]